MKNFNLQEAVDWIREHDNCDIDEYALVKTGDGRLNIKYYELSTKKWRDVKV